ncbi:hypothetical protein PMAYCL1PPCAC_32669, partial [Pristionchus mayeri]
LSKSFSSHFRDMTPVTDCHCSENNVSESPIEYQNSDTPEMVVDVRSMEADEEVEQILEVPLGRVEAMMDPEDAAKEGVMKIIRANISRITEQVNKIDYDRLKRSQIQHFNRYGCFSC